jgi:hypothetical protein
MATAVKTFTLTVISLAPPTRSGVVAHMVSGGGWKTSIWVTTTGSSPAAVRLLFHGEDGSALTLPLIETQSLQGQTGVRGLTTSTVDAVLNPNSTALVTTAPTDANTSEGWVEILSSGATDGYGTFSYAFSNGTTSEATVPIQSQSPSTIDVPYNDGAGYFTGIALTNLSSNAETVTITVFSAAGSPQALKPILLPANGHSTFVLSNVFPSQFTGPGIVKFQSTGGLAAIGLRISPALNFTSLPIIIPE